MGSLAFWGGVAGGAEGWKTNIERNRADEAARQDAAREEALERLKHSNQMELEGVKQEGATTRTGMQTESAEGIAGSNIESREGIAAADNQARAELQQGDQEWRSAEAELNRTHEKELSRINSSRNRSDPHLSSLYDRYKNQTLTQGETVPGTSIMMEAEMPATYDDLSGRWYLHDGDKLIPPGGAGEVVVTNDAGEEFRRTPTSEHIEALYGNPGMEDQFISYFGFLPSGFLDAKRVFDINQYMDSANGSVTETTSQPAFTVDESE